MRLERDGRVCWTCGTSGRPGLSSPVVVTLETNSRGWL
uniref:Uncharacterized protein n=1 Tax=Anguilla anguilla TaxID=7936 RepID=A0A0E9W1T7_ANGAN